MKNLIAFLVCICLIGACTKKSSPSSTSNIPKKSTPSKKGKLRTSTNAPKIRTKPNNNGKFNNNNEQAKPSTTAPVQKSFASQAQVIELPLTANTKGRIAPPSPCNNKHNYPPSEIFPTHTPMRHIRVNVHFISHPKQKYNFSEQEGTIFAEYLIEEANKLLSNNKKMFLPANNNTPAVPPRFRYVLTPEKGVANDDGIYFHYNDSLFQYNKKVRRGQRPASIFSKKQFDFYGVNKKEAINILMLEHPVDSIKAKGYKPSSEGVGKVEWCKIVGAFHHYTERFKKTSKAHEDPLRVAAAYYAKLLNHELGHSLGLAHTWASADGCEDTPKNQNCWNTDKKDPNCDERSKVSNNVMDYNAYRDAYTPCQLSKIHYQLSKLNNRRRKLLQPLWCTNIHEDVVVPKGQKIVWNCHKDLNGNLIIEEGATLTVLCTLSMPPDSKIIVQPTAQLILDNCMLTNHCEKAWEGIEIWTNEKASGEVLVKGEVKVRHERNQLRTVK